MSKKAFILVIRAFFTPLFLKYAKSSQLLTIFAVYFGDICWYNVTDNEKGGL